MDTKIKQNQQQGNTAHYKPLTGPEWTKASETGSDADAVRIHRFMDAQEAKGLFNLTFFGMWEPTLRRCTCECVPKILYYQNPLLLYACRKRCAYRWRMPRRWENL